MIEWTDKCFQSEFLILLPVLQEHERQLEKWGVQTRSVFEWMNYLTEEVGELAQAISENVYRNGNTDNIFKEAIQVATLALKIAEMSGGKEAT